MNLFLFAIISFFVLTSRILAQDAQFIESMVQSMNSHYDTMIGLLGVQIGLLSLLIGVVFALVFATSFKTR